MATRTDPTHSQAISKFLFPLLGNRSLTWLGYIRVGAEGDSSAEDALTVLNEKFDDGNFLSSSTNLPVADADQAALHYRTDENALYIKQRTGSPGSYSYSWLGPIDRGDYQSRLIYHTATDPPSPVISWNAQNETFNITGGGWTINELNARWMRIVVLPAASNTASVSPELRIADPTATDISVTSPDGNGNLPSSINNVQELATWLDNDAQFGSGGGGGGSGTDDQTAAEVPTATDNFNQNLSTDDRNVQLALDTIDNLNIPLLQVNEYGHSDTTYSDTVRFLETVQSFAYIDISVDQDLRNHRDTLGDTLYFECLLTFRLQRGTADVDTMRLRAELADRGTNTAISSRIASVPSNTVEITESTTSTVDGSVRIAGPLPRTLNEARLQFVVENNPGPSPAEGYVQVVRMEIRPQVNSDEVIMNPDDLGNNIMNDATLVDLNDFASQVDELPIQPGDYEDVDWPGLPNGIDVGGADSQKQRDIPIAQRIRDFNARAERQFIAKISYRINYISGTRTGGRTNIDYVHEVRSDADNYASVITRWQATQDATADDVSFEVTIPAAATQLRVTYERPLNQANTRVDQQGARINVVDYELEYLEGIDSSGFTTAGRIATTNTRSLQSLAQAVYNHVPTNAATGVTVDSDQFIDPNRGRGGLRDDLTQQGVTITTPTNVQMALNKADGIFRLLDNPFIANDMLTRSGGNHDFTVNSATAVRSEAITIPQDLRDLGVDVTLRLKIRVNTITSTFDGNVSFVDCDSPHTIIDGTMSRRVRNQGTSDTFAAGDFLIFQETVAASQVPDEFCVQFERDSSTGNANFHRGTAYMAVGAGGAGGAGGQAGGWEIIWQAGPGDADRVTVSSTTTVYTLLNGRRFDDFEEFEIIYDTNATRAVAISDNMSYDEIELMLDSGPLDGNQATWILIRYDYKLIKPMSQTSFRIQAGAAGVGVRRLRGR